MIFVTGGPGLVGSHILLKLSQRGEELKALKRATSSMDICKSVFTYYNADDLFAQINWVDGDVNDAPCGDMNNDNVLDILDVVILVNVIMSFTEDTEELFCRGNLNADDVLDILDIIILVNMVLAE